MMKKTNASTKSQPEAGVGMAYSLLENEALAIEVVDDLFEQLWMGEMFECIGPPIHRFLYAELQAL